MTALRLGKAGRLFCSIPLQRAGTSCCLVYVEKREDVMGLSKFLRSVGGGVNGRSVELQSDSMIYL